MACVVSDSCSWRACCSPARKPKKKKEPAAPPAPPTAVLPSPVSTATLEAFGPALIGMDEALDITAMTRSKTMYAFRLPVEFLADLPDGAAEPVMQTLAAHPSWRVFDSAWGLRAALREDGSVGPAGYVTSGAEAWGLFVSSDVPDASPWSSQVLRVSAADGEADCPGLVLPSGPFRGSASSAFLIDGDGMGVAIHEVGDVDSRDATLAALVALQRDLDIAVSTVDLVVDSGVDGMYLPNGEPGRTASLSLSSPGKGLLELEARAAPPSWGWTWLRLVTPSGPWEEAAVGAATREMLDSGKDGQFFYMQAQIPVPAGEAFEATAELWFAPPGGKGTLLSATPVTVPAR
jgi:hypothetical protein